MTTWDDVEEAAAEVAYWEHFTPPHAAGAQVQATSLATARALYLLRLTDYHHTCRAHPERLARGELGGPGAGQP